MNKILVIGDLHLDDKYPGYLNAQCQTIINLVHRKSPSHIIFLGDIFHYRAPKPTVLLEFRGLLDEITWENPHIKKIYLLRGNHDTVSKSDSSETVLDLFNTDTVYSVSGPWFDNELALHFIPHYESTNIIEKYLASTDIDCNKQKPGLRKNCATVFGHFGYTGCLNSIGINDFSVDIKHFKYKTFLGHIHKFKEEGNITVLGTPWSTSFTECDYPHYYAILTGDGLAEYKTEIKEIDFGVRHYVIPFEALEANKEDISNPKYKTILRVLISKFDPNGILANPSELRKKILKEYGVLWVDLKFQPVLTDKLAKQSTFIPGNSLSDLDDKIISQYIEENKTSIPNDDLMKILDEVKEHQNS